MGFGIKNSGRGRPAKDPFEALDDEFKDAVAGMDEAQIRDRIAKVALDELANLSAKDDDQDLATKQEEAKVAGEGYKEATKMNRLRIRFAKRVLQDKGFLKEDQ